MQDTWVDRLTNLIDGTDVDVYVGSRNILESVTGFHVHRGALAAMHRPELPSIDAVVAKARRVVILEDLVDHTNVGAIFRSAAGLGMDAVLVTPRCADPLYRRSVRVSMAAVFAVPWTRIDPWPGSLAVLRERGFRIAAVTPRGPHAIPLSEFARQAPDHIALVLGTEGDGLTSPALEAADVSVSIPMQAGVDSLNVAAASAVVFWALATPPLDQPAPGN
jgi:tRNA G18 (ribose-2'-O)-methylase SpoU